MTNYSCDCGKTCVEDCKYYEPEEPEPKLPPDDEREEKYRYIDFELKGGLG